MKVNFEDSGSEDIWRDRAVSAIFSKAVTAAMEDGWTETHAVFFLAELADEHLLNLWRARAELTADNRTVGDNG